MTLEILNLYTRPVSCELYPPTTLVLGEELQTPIN
jgi:hypothetical protein